MNFADQIAMGQGGSALASGATVVTPPTGKAIVAIQALTDVAVAASGTVAESGFADLSNRTIPSGVTIVGRYSAFKGTSGDYAIVYFG